MQHNTLFPSLPSPFVFGHRGYNEIAIENTMDSFDLCYTNKVQGIELDIHLCKSGHIVVIHDHNLKRLAQVDKRVEDLTFDELKELKIEGSGQIPLLEEVLSTYTQSFYYDIELKVTAFGQQEIVEKTHEIISRYHLEDNIIISSFNPIIIRRWNKKTKKSTHTGIIYSEHDEVPSYLHKGQGRFIAHASIIKPHHELVTPSLVKNYHKKGYGVVTWSPHKEEDIMAMITSNVDGIICDDPVKVMSIIAGLKERH